MRKQRTFAVHPQHPSIDANSPCSFQETLVQADPSRHQRAYAAIHQLNKYLVLSLGLPLPPLLTGFCPDLRINIADLQVTTSRTRR